MMGSDPQDFSENSIDGAASPSSSVRPIDVTPPSSTAIPEIIHTYTPTGINEHGVKGILRPSGTPGSGNGGMDLGRNFRYRADTGLVRFFPKNRFRVITPNHSLHSPQPPTSPRSSSFLSQLLAVTMPSMSPRKPLPVEKPDESWEVPGQEGEVSLVASSLASLDQSGEEQDQSIEQAREESWNGTPEKHSSPLALPSNTDVSASGECELPSTDWQVPEDMSNLLSQRFSQTDIDSFSISEPPPPKPPLMTSIEYADEIEELDDTMGSIRSSEGLNDSNPTVRRLLSPAGVDKIELEPGTPTPGNRPFTSIFADMSAEQANLSWPLTRPTAGERDHTTFHSVVLNDILDLPQHTVTPKAGDITQFFDCTTTSLSPPVPSLSSSSTSLVSRNSPISLDLLQPSKALFEAHSVHTSALASELALYRALAEKLHHEVEERDGVLADLNLRVLAGEVWRVRVEELEAELNADKLIPASSPSPVFHTQRRRRSAEREGDRTTVMDTETRELEIRLAKALADLEMLGRHLTQVRADAEYQAGQITEARRSLAMAEQRERDSQVRDEGLRAQIAQDAELRIDLDQARHLELELRIQLDEAGRRTTDLEVQVEESREIKQADEEVKSRLGVSLEKLKQGRNREEEWRFQVGELEREVQIERSRRTDAERRVEEEKEEIVRLESQNREVGFRLTRIILLNRSTSYSRACIPPAPG